MTLIFTSGTQALQGRTVNHDETPWLGLPGHTNTPNRYATREMGESAPFWDTVTPVPRPEFVVLDNPILAQFRAASWPRDIGTWLFGLDKLGDDGGFYKLTPISPEQVEHAKRVLTRLALLAGLTI